MEFSATTVFDRIVKAYLAGKRLIVSEGGTSSSKTFSTIQFLIFLANFSKRPLLISIVSETYPHLRRGAIRDFQTLMGAAFNKNAWNKSESIYNFGKSKIEFFAADMASKLRGGRRDILFINEANNISKESFDELDVRTRLLTIIDFNPVEEFWAHEMKELPFVEWIHSTFLDAAHVLDRAVVDNILSRKDRDPNWWRVYGLGLVGKIEGLVHAQFSQVGELPEGGIVRYGLDFGYSMDPAVLSKNVIIDDRLYSRELFYEKGLTNQKIVKRFENWGIRKGVDIIIADSAEPKSIDEIAEYGYDIRPAQKGPDSVNAGIQKVNQYRQFWTKDSLNCIKEQRNYRWDKNKDGKFMDTPIDDFNHGMDSRRYPVASVPERQIVVHKAKIIVKEFKLQWDPSKVPEKYVLHYAAASLTDDGIFHMLAGVWDNFAGCLYIYHAEDIEEVSQDTTVPAIIELLRLRYFSFERFLATKKIISDEYGISEVFKKGFDRYLRSTSMRLVEPRRYDMYGSIALLNQMVNESRLIIHPNAQPLAVDLSRWHASNGKIKAEGQMEALLIFISELEEREVVRPFLQLSGYKYAGPANFGIY